MCFGWLVGEGVGVIGRLVEEASNPHTRHHNRTRTINTFDYIQSDNHKPSVYLRQILYI